MSAYQTAKVTCEIVANTRNLAELFVRLKMRQVNLRKVELMQSLVSPDAYYLHLELDCPEGFPNPLNSYEQLKAFIQ